ncbi:hypothetical protein KQI63_14165 [bacterium]|nr:hypothetical protein [bacterium]
MDKPDWLTSGTRLLLDTFWPRECVVCGSGERVGPGDVCDHCFAALLPARSVDSPSYIKRLVVGFAYDSALRRIVHRFKFEGVKALAEPLAVKLDKRLQFTGQFPEAGILVPVPSHRTRLRERGYNPSERLTDELSKLWNVDHRPELAKRVQAGPHQSSLPDEKRKNTLKGAFQVSPPGEGEERVPLLLFDDVIHTGNTLRRLGEAARKAGWKHVEAICLCN